MTTISDEPRFHIGIASEEDWPWIERGEVEIARSALQPGRQCDDDGDQHAIEALVAERVVTIRRQDGFPNQAFVARSGDGALAGYVWVAKTHNDATGELEASLLSQYVVASCRGHGLGRRLIATAEGWAREQGLPCLSLFVGTRNRLAQRLYESLGYRVETLRMTKRLDGEDSGEDT